ncbi:MAG: DNA polymerase I [Caldiserica bacterium]|nr:DNA polymerase I [Caldisericota bacterium]
MTNRVVLVDGSSILYRAFFAMPHLSTATGVPTGAILGTTTMLLTIIEDLQPQYMGVFFDRKAATYRHEMFEDYKANRESMPDELVSQLGNLKQLIQSLGIVTREKDGFEADDFIGIYSKVARQAGIPCTIYSGDNDLLQLTDDNTSVRITVKGVKEVREYTPAAILSEFGLKAPQLIDVKALKGDTSDNIPGVHGIGDKTALKLIQEFGSVEALLENGGPERYRALLAENRDIILRNRSLVTILMSLDEPTSLADLERGDPDSKQCSELFQTLSFLTLSRRASKVLGVPSLAVAPASVRRDSLFDADGPSPAVAPVPLAALNVVLDNRMALALIPDVEGQGFTVARRTKDVTWSTHVDAMFGSLPAALASDGASMTYVYDYKQLCHALAPFGLAAPVPIRDVMLAQYLLDPDQKAWGLDRIGEAWGLDGHTSTPEGLANLVYRVSGPIDAALEESQLTRTLNEMEMPFAAVLADMEMAGIRTDTAYLRTFGAKLGLRIAELEHQAYDLVGTRDFSLQSPKQLGVLLFDVLGLAPTKKTKTGLSTDVESLEAIQNEHPAIPLILELRQLTKIKGTYTDSLVRYVAPDGKIHPTFLQTGTATGRISCVDPNLQNIPARTEVGREIRQAFIASHDGWVLVSADYSQIDLRMLAHLSADANLCHAFAQGEDIHLHTASQVFDVPESAVTPEMRKRAKTINFGIIYGISPYGLSRQLGISGDEARQYIERYLERFPGIRDYRDRVVEAAQRDGYVKTILGHLRRVPHINSHNNVERQEAIRQGFNAVVQGSSADAIKMAMISLSKDLQPLKARMVLQVHDEIVVDTPPDELDLVRGMMQGSMESAIHLSVPLVTHLSAGPNLRDLT